MYDDRPIRRDPHEARTGHGLQSDCCGHGHRVSQRMLVDAVYEAFDKDRRWCTQYRRQDAYSAHNRRVDIEVRRRDTERIHPPTCLDDGRAREHRLQEGADSSLRQPAHARPVGEDETSVRGGDNDPRWPHRRPARQPPSA